MSPLTLETLEGRVAALEQTVAQLLHRPPQPPVFKDWRQAVGQFQGTDLTREIDEAGRQIREADRRDTRP